jgi:hypothetical protein
MKVYFAGISGHKKRLEYLKKFGANKLMLTFAEVKSYNRNMPRFKEGNFDILFDSGAFSLWRRGISIDIQEYCKYLLMHNIGKYITLDKIGNHSETMVNQKIMEDFGMNPIPVYHLNSPIENLYEICEKYSYVCLGGTVGSQFSVRLKFFTEVFEHFPNHKFHGLGLTDSRLTEQFPFYSVDSTTWLCAAKAGKILDGNGKQCHAPPEMDLESKFSNTIGFFVKMGDKNGQKDSIN